MLKVYYIFFLLCVFAGLTSCKPSKPSEAGVPDEQLTDNVDSRTELLTTLFNVTVIITNGQQVVAKANVQIDDEIYASNENGEINLENLSFGNHAVFINENGYFPFTSILSINADSKEFTFTLYPVAENHQHLLFAGDTMFGRRYLDPELKTMTTDIPDVDNALVNPDTAAEDAIAITRFVAPFFAAANFTSVNLESPITGTPQTTHPTKDFTFFSLPNSLEGLTSVGIDYVGLGNNHIYDYLQDGLADTLVEVENNNLNHSGAGVNQADAFAIETYPLKGITLALFAGTSITGTEHEQTYVADKNKGGAADLTDSIKLDETFEAIDNSLFTIAQLHGGDEYSYSPSPYIDTRFSYLSERGVDLLVAHHPHVAQGFAVYGNVPAILGLGNFVFDQLRLETMLGLVVQVDVDTQTQAVERAFAYPIYIEDYIPKFVNGFASDYLLRRLSEFSDDNITLIPKDGYAEVYFTSGLASTSEQVIEVSVDEQQPILDLRKLAPSSKAYLSKITVVEGAINDIHLGRDLMIFGDFEDWDNDTEQLEVARWDHSGDSVNPCINDAYSGVQSLCSSRTQFDDTPSLIPFRQTIRTMELTDENGAVPVAKEFSLLGYLKGTNAGKLDVQLTYTTEEDALEFGTETIKLTDGGNLEWQVFSQDFSLPSDEQTLGDKNLPPRGVKVLFRHFPPKQDEANLHLDDIAVIAWQKTIKVEQNTWATSRMHGFDFLKVNSDVTLELTFTTLK